MRTLINAEEGSALIRDAELGPAEAYQAHLTDEEVEQQVTEARFNRASWRVLAFTVVGVTLIIVGTLAGLTALHPASFGRVASKALEKPQVLIDSQPPYLGSALDFAKEVQAAEGKLAADRASQQSTAERAKEALANSSIEGTRATEELAWTEGNKTRAGEMKLDGERLIQESKDVLQEMAGVSDDQEAKKMKRNATKLQREGEEELEEAESLSTEMLEKEQDIEEERSEAQEWAAEAQSLTGSADNLDNQSKKDEAAMQALLHKEVSNYEKLSRWMKKVAHKDKAVASVESKKADKTYRAAEKVVEAAQRILDKADAKMERAAAMESHAEKQLDAAAALRKQGAHKLAKATAAQHRGEQAVAAGDKVKVSADAAQNKSNADQAEVSALERKAMDTMASHRICVDLPGVNLREPGAPNPFAPVAVEKDVNTSEKCTQWCLSHEGCAQATWSGWNSQCKLFAAAAVEAVEWKDVFNTSLCADKMQQPQLLQLQNRILTQKPMVPEAYDCSWAGEDCASTKCCNDLTCSWDFKTCTGYSCYQQTDGTGQCLETASWNSGAIVGGPRAAREITQAIPGWTLQGTSLFCFMVVNFKTPEADLAKHLEDKKLGIHDCDASSVLSGWETGKTDWATWINADLFIKMWQQVRDEQRYMSYDWTVKVDPDTVFFPHILRLRLEGLKTPQGAKVYIKNFDYKFQFPGAIEVISREAVEQYFLKGDKCGERLNAAHPKQGEDFFMKACLEAIGVDYQEDFNLLHENSCGDDCPGGNDKHCSDGWTAAFHPRKDVGSWDSCYKEAVAAQKEAGTQEQGKKEKEAPETVEFPASDCQEAQDAAAMLKQVVALKKEVEPDAKAAREQEAAADAQLKKAHKDLKAAMDRVAAANAMESKAANMTKKAKNESAAAALLKAAGEELEQEGNASKAIALHGLAAAQAVVDVADADEANADDEWAQAVDAETKALAATGTHRECFDLPGVRLMDGSPVELHAIVLKDDIHDYDSCRDWCLKHFECKQVIYAGDSQGCYLFSNYMTQPHAFKESYNSSYCGSPADHATMLELTNNIYKMKPYVPPLRECSWAGDNCMSSQCCANVPVPNWQFTEFKWYTCYKKDMYFAGCYLGAAPSDWDGTVLGSAGTREVPKADEGVLVQGSSLFCFAVVAWWRGPTQGFWDSEASLANNINASGRSIFQCDEHAYIEAGGLNGGGDGSSINNIDSFIGAWEKVRDDGRWANHDWTVKVDVDCVFFPDRLKAHLRDLRTPQGSRVYLRNIGFKFEFLGALEVFTKEALELYYEKQSVCREKVGHEGGEDYWMEACMDGIGVDHQTDHQLLNDKYAANGNCFDPWVVGFHFYKKVADWNECWDAATNTAKNQGLQFKK